MRNLFLLLFLFLLFISCSDVSDGGSMGECMVGIFITEENNPVDNAQVKLYQKNGSGVLEVFDSTTTDSDGSFTFKEPDAGIYCLESYVKSGDKTDTLLTFFTEGIEYVSGVKDVGVLVMKAPGKIKGHVTFDTDDVSGVLCYIPGTSFNAYTDDSGVFVISNLAENSYNLVVDGSLYDAVTVKDIDVISNQTTDIGEIPLILDTNLVPIPPEGLEATYDSATGLCMVQWDALNLLDLAGYLLYRQTAEQEYPILVQTEKIEDTFYIDSLWNAVHDKDDKSVSYQLKSIDHENNISIQFSPKFLVTPTSGPEIDEKDSVRVAVNGMLSGNTAIVSKVTATITSGGSKGPIPMEWHPVSKRFLGAVMRADSGTMWTTEIHVYDAEDHLVGYGSCDFDKLTDTISVPEFNCANAKPTVIAMKDTTLSVSDSLILTASVIDTLSIDGKVTKVQEFKYEWSIGDGEFSTVSTLDTMIVLPEVVSDSFTCVVRVTDSDGNVSKPDTVVIQIKNDTPVIEIVSHPTETAFDGEKVTIKIKATDTLGTIVSTQYKMENQNTFTSYTGDSVSITIPQVPDADFTITFQVTDEDGNTAVDSCQFPINVWSKVFGGYDDDEPRTAVELDDGSLFIVGNSNSFSASQDILLYHVDSKGEVLWKKTYGGAEEEIAYGMIPSSTGVFLCGYTRSEGNGERDCYLLSLDISGTVIEEKTYGFEKDDIAYFLDIYDDHSYLLVGTTNSFGNGDYDGLVIKIDQNGDTLWMKNYGGAYYERLIGFDVTSIGDIILLGQKVDSNSNEDLWLLKIDSNGTIIWEKIFGGTRTESAGYVSTLSNGNIMIGGSTNSSGSGDYEGWVFETDSSGTLLWEKHYGSEFNDFCEIVKPMGDGTYLLTGAQNSPADSWLAKIDTKGEIIWERTFGGDNGEFSWDAIELIDGGIISVSVSNSFSNGKDFWITKFDSHGNSVNLP